MEIEIVYQGGSAEVVEKRSRFIANVFPICSVDEALDYLEQIRKKHYDARHNCFVYVLGDKNETVRSSDDGEPAGTAGHPMLDVVVGAGVHNVLVVVTRYFGGTLLGTGGLVRAYSEATKKGLEACTIITRKQGTKKAVVIDYSGVGKLQYVVATMGLTELQSEYGETVTVTLLVPEGQEHKVFDQITEASSGKAQIEDLGTVCYADVDGETVFFDA